MFRIFPKKISHVFDEFGMFDVFDELDMFDLFEVLDVFHVFLRILFPEF